MAGEIESWVVESDGFMRDEVTVVSEQRFASGRKVVGYLPIPHELMADAAALDGLMAHQLDRVFRPWLHPDCNPFPVIDLFPRWTRLGAFLGRVRQRFVREGEPREDDW